MPFVNGGAGGRGGYVQYKGYERGGGKTIEGIFEEEKEIEKEKKKEIKDGTKKVLKQI